MQPSNADVKTLAKSLASEIAALFSAPLPPLDERKSFLAYSDLFWMAAHLFEALEQFGIAPERSEWGGGERGYDPVQFENALYRRIVAKSRGLSPDQYRIEIKRMRDFFSAGRSERQLHLRLARKVLPAGKAGRTRKISPEELLALARLSKQLLPAISKFLEVHKHAPNSTTKQTLDYVRNEFSADIAEYLHQHSAYLDREFKRLPKQGTAYSKARQLSDILAGCKWGLSPSYAARMCKQARSEMSRSSTSS